MIECVSISSGPGLSWNITRYALVPVADGERLLFEWREEIGRYEKSFGEVVAIANCTGFPPYIGGVSNGNMPHRHALKQLAPQANAKELALIVAMYMTCTL